MPPMIILAALFCYGYWIYFLGASAYLAQATGLGRFATSTDTVGVTVC